MLHNTDAIRYLKEIKKEVPCVGNSRMRILRGIRGVVEEFVSENPNASYSVIEARFGSPSQIVSTYLSELGAPEIIKGLKTRRKIITILLVLAISIFAVWASAVSLAMLKYNTNESGFIIEEITEITSIPN